MSFFKKDIAESSVVSKRFAKELNGTVDLKVRANSFINPIMPKAGKLLLGDVGAEFRTESGLGYIQIPWTSVVSVSVDIQGKNYVRSITFLTSESEPLQFVIDKGDDVVRLLSKKLGRDKLSVNKQGIKKIGEKLTGLFKK